MAHKSDAWRDAADDAVLPPGTAGYRASVALNNSANKLIALEKELRELRAQEKIDAAKLQQYNELHAADLRRISDKLVGDKAVIKSYSEKHKQLIEHAEELMSGIGEEERISAQASIGELEAAHGDALRYDSVVQTGLRRFAEEAARKSSEEVKGLRTENAALREELARAKQMIAAMKAMAVSEADKDALQREIHRLKSELSAVESRLEGERTASANTTV
ncbi:hypothetical protein LTR16_001659 [Cryomyces antarcticus]|uniref:GDP/GTP exchange factor Sec2 N-terminal domain-containing protein n=1 Tax=Cryomyces antarcticus TaxID=329879 RepID=A0ABR0LZ85_9PEZI|nr:hypothetical protein LTR39_000723 [Cryomyces antarcticus]KAK5019966.1 hypothetical protein LTR60_000969 [Cryomyces antarcticus]KAK5257082.1 hypothetical protein LTR16_001659 [Cryomyces antarcticus]